MYGRIRHVHMRMRLDRTLADAYVARHGIDIFECSATEHERMHIRQDTAWTYANVVEQSANVCTYGKA